MKINGSISFSRLNTSSSSLSSSSILLKEYNSLSGEDWITKLKECYEEATENVSNQMDLEHWKNSRLKYLLYNEKIGNLQLIECFHQIDSDCDGLISWKELLNYVICQQKAYHISEIDKNLKISCLMPDPKQTHKLIQSIDPICIKYIPYDDQIGVLSKEYLGIWRFSDAKLVKTLNVTGDLVDFTYLNANNLICIAKSTRQLVFFDPKTFQKLRFCISATFDTGMIHDLSEYDSRDLLERISKKQSPLFHSPSSIESHPTLPIIFVGDEEGYVEVLRIVSSPGFKEKLDFQILKKRRIHDDRINQIRSVPSENIYASSSDDGSVCLWFYDPDTVLLSVTHRIVNPNNDPIKRFAFDERTKLLICSTSSHYILSVRVFSTSCQIIPISSKVSCFSIIPISELSSFLLIVGENGFILLYSIPDLVFINTMFFEDQHKSCIPTASGFFINRLIFVGSYLSMWNCETSDSEGFKAHQTKIVGLVANEALDHMITCDQKGEIIVWDLKTGMKVYLFQVGEKNQSVMSIATDEAKRRIVIGFSSGSIKIISNSSGTLLNEIPKKNVEGGCIQVVCGTLNQMKYIISITGRKQVCLFEDLPGSRVQFSRSFIGHNENIVFVVVLKKSLILTAGNEKEMFLWTPKSVVPQIRFIIEKEPICGADIAESNDLFIYGDSNGILHLLSINQKTPIHSVNPFSNSEFHPISAISVIGPNIVVGNSEGNISLMRIFNHSLSILTIFRAHSLSIQNIWGSISTRTILTSGLDEIIRVWSLDGGIFIGEIGKNTKWSIHNKESWVKLNPLTLPQIIITDSEIPQTFDVEESNEESISEELTTETYKPLTIPEFTFQNYFSLIEDIDRFFAVDDEGESIALKYCQEKTANEERQENNLLMFEDLISNKKIEENLSFIKKFTRKRQKIHGTSSDG